MYETSTLGDHYLEGHEIDARNPQQVRRADELPKIKAVIHLPSRDVCSLM